MFMGTEWKDGNKNDFTNNIIIIILFNFNPKRIFFSWLLFFMLSLLFEYLRF